MLESERKTKRDIQRKRETKPETRERERKKKESEIQKAREIKHARTSEKTRERW